MNKKITSALISVFYKEGLEPVVRELQQQGATLYSTGGTQTFIEALGIPVVPVESLTTYPSILGGRVKTLHPSVFGGILGRRDNETDLAEMQQYNIPVLDLVVVDLYPFEETLAQVQAASFTGNEAAAEKAVIEKIDIGGPSMIRAAAKNFSHVAVIASKEEYVPLVEMLQQGGGELSVSQRKAFAAKAFKVVADYDIAINNYFNASAPITVISEGEKTPLRYGENPHQQAGFYGNLSSYFGQLHGKELSYNNLVDTDAAMQLIGEFPSSLPTPNTPPSNTAKSTENTDPLQSGPGTLANPSAAADGGAGAAVFAIIKHTNVCGIAVRSTVAEAWSAALAGDPESAFGGVLVTNKEVDEATAAAINELFFEVLIAPSFSEAALAVLQSKKARILLQQKAAFVPGRQYKSILGGSLVQDADSGNFEKWEEVSGNITASVKADLIFANIVCKHLKSNAIALVKNGQLVGKGCGQTSRIDALRQAIEKAAQFGAGLQNAVMASDAFFPFDDCVKLGHGAGIAAFIQPGGSIRDKDSIAYCQANGLAMVLTGQRHFKH